MVLKYMTIWTVINWLKIMSMACSSELGNELSDSIKGGEFRYNLGDHQLLNEDFIPFHAFSL